MPDDALSTRNDEFIGLGAGSRRYESVHSSSTRHERLSSMTAAVDTHFDQLAHHYTGDSAKRFVDLSELPPIEELLRPHDELVVQIQGLPSDVIARRQRILWATLVAVALVWGCLTGLAIGVRGFFLAVPPAMLGCGSIGVLAATLWTMAKEQK